MEFRAQFLPKIPKELHQIYSFYNGEGLSLKLVKNELARLQRIIGLEQKQLSFEVPMRKLSILIIGGKNSGKSTVA